MAHIGLPARPPSTKQIAPSLVKANDGFFSSALASWLALTDAGKDTAKDEMRSKPLPSVVFAFAYQTSSTHPRRHKRVHGIVSVGVLVSITSNIEFAQTFSQ